MSVSSGVFPLALMPRYNPKITRSSLKTDAWTRISQSEDILSYCQSVSIPPITTNCSVRSDSARSSRYRRTADQSFLLFGCCHFGSGPGIPGQVTTANQFRMNLSGAHLLALSGVMSETLSGSQKEGQSSRWDTRHDCQGDNPDL